MSLPVSPCPPLNTIGYNLWYFFTLGTSLYKINEVELSFNPCGGSRVYNTTE
uniref:Uncharacterized protein n=1 Tax=Anguilla anguilla TaxID=7936 RepID=A0A0E9UT82_ANGAN